VLFLNRQVNDWVLVLLIGFNSWLYEVWGRILGRISLPALQKSVSKVRREEAQQSIMMCKSASITESSALVTKGDEEGKRDGNKLWCDDCNR